MTPDPTVRNSARKEASFEAFEWKPNGALTPKQIRELGSHPKRAPVSEVEFHEFFSALTQEQDWYGKEEKERVQKYRELLAVFEQDVSDPAIFCVGKTDVTFYIVGRSLTGHWVGVQTDAPET